MPKTPDTTSAKPKAAKKSGATRTPNSKASKPELKPLDGYLADLLNPAINRGKAVPGGAAGFSDAPQAGYEARPGDAEAGKPRKLSKKADSAFDPDSDSAASLTAKSLQALLETGSPFIEPGKPWTPHRPERPEKSEGGIRLHDEIGFLPVGRPADRDRRSRRRHPPAGARPGSARRHRLGQDLHHGQGDRGDAAPGADPRARTRRWRRSSTASSRASSPTTRSSTSSPTTTITSRRPTSRARTPISRRNPRSTSRSTACAIRRRARCWNATTSSSSPRLLHLRYRLGRDLYGDDLLDMKLGERIEQRQLHRRSRRAAIQAHPARFFARHLPGARRHVIELWPGPL